MTETRAQLYTSSWQAPYHSFRRKRQNSFILLPLLSPQSFATLRGPHEVIAFCRKVSPVGSVGASASQRSPPETRTIAWSLMISAKVPCSIHPEEATLPLRCLATATPLWTCRRGTIASNHSPTTSEYPPVRPC